MSRTSIDLITCSYSGDFEMCSLLCESIDRFAPDGMTHHLYVPRSDFAVFYPLQNARRKISAQEDLLPKWLVKLPLPKPERRRRLHLSVRNVYLTPFTPPIRGWIAQQIMKISATLRSQSDVVAHIDSDNVFIRPIDVAQIIFPDGTVRFYAGRHSLGLETHKPWYASARKLLGVAEGDVYMADYIDQFVTWKRTVVEALVGRIEEISGSSWEKTLAKTPHFSEYVLYGVFAEHVLGRTRAGLSKKTQSLSLWTGRRSAAEEAPASAEGLSPAQLVCNIQSTLPVTIEERRDVFRFMVERAAEQDAQQ